MAFLFELKLDIPSDETINAIEEGRKIAKDESFKSYENMDDLRRALEVSDKVYSEL
ncbi:MAG: toxin-antitoxin system protein [Tissierellia bacterium]|nr:toxin-antitoxin system protein [Tissierellia bacterium]